MIASRAGLTFNDFLLHLTPILIVLMVAYLGICRVYFRRAFAGHRDHPLDMDPTAEITDGRLLAKCLAVLGAVIVGFVLHSVLHVQPALVAMLGAAAMVVVSGSATEQFLADVEWETLVFFMALFVLVGGLAGTGVIDRLGAQAVEATDERWFLVSTVLIFGSAVLGAFVDNIPYTAAMLPIVEDLVAADPEAARPVWWALALGADLGGNTTAVAAGANVVVTGIAARAGSPVSFWEFTRHGMVVSAITLSIAWVYVWLRYFAI